MTAERKPIPVPDDASRPFFDGARHGQLMLLECGRCHTMMWPLPAVVHVNRPNCTSCFSRELSWQPVSGMGTLYSFALMHQSYHPAFEADLPYNLAAIDLDEGVRMRSVVRAEPQDLRIGMRLRARFDDVGGGVHLPSFEPA